MIRAPSHLRTHVLCAPIAALLAAPWCAAAQDTPPFDGEDSFEPPPGYEAEIPDDGYETVVRGHSIRPTDEGTGFGETIDVADETRRFTAVSDVVSDMVGVQVRRTGGAGAQGLASIRGSTSGQVPVYLDGVLLNSAGASSVDLGQLSLDTVDSIEVYRGFTPASLGTAGIGGAINLRSSRAPAPSTRLSLTYGSWDTARLFASRSAPVGQARALAILSASGSRGDFEYLNRNGTPLNDDDDRVARRQNNHHIAYASLLKLDGEAGPLRWILANDLAAAVRGVAGIESVQTEQASLRSLRDTVSARGEVPLGPGARLEMDAGYLGLREDFDDSDNEIGVGFQRTVARTDAGFGGASLELELGARNRATARVESRFEQLRQEDLVADRSFTAKRRVRSALVLGHLHTAGDGALGIGPTVRLEHHHCAFGGDTVDDFHLQPSLGLRVALFEGLSFRANAGRFVRAPELHELFGDRGSVVGNPTLEPETSFNADAGLVYLIANAGPFDLARIEAVAFGAQARDLIAYVQNSQSTIRPENVSKAGIGGVETSVRVLLWERVSLHGNYTWLHAVNRSDYPYYRGKRLPGRPVHELYAKVELSDEIDGWAPRLWFDLDYAGRNYLDQANLEEDVLARILLGLGAGLEWVPARVALTIEIENLLDATTARDQDGRLRPLRDLEAFPLPGRAVFATLSWRS